MTQTGVYAFASEVNGKHYIGSTSSGLQKRRTEHVRDLRKGRHRNRHLQSAWSKHGEEAFSFIILAECSPEECVPTEQAFIDAYLDAGIPLYNLSLTAGSVLGMKFGPPSEEKRRKISDGNKGKTLSKEHVAAIVAANTGKRMSDENRAKMIELHTGAKRSEETKNRIGARSKGRIPGEETRKKMSAARLGRAVSEETRNKVSKSLTGRQRSESERQAMKDGWARKKAREAENAVEAAEGNPPE